jgi:hypothetical protein
MQLRSSSLSVAGCAPGDASPLPSAAATGPALHYLPVVRGGGVAAVDPALQAALNRGNGGGGGGGGVDGDFVDLDDVARPAANFVPSPLLSTMSVSTLAFTDRFETRTDVFVSARNAAGQLLSAFECVPSDITVDVAADPPLPPFVVMEGPRPGAPEVYSFVYTPLGDYAASRTAPSPPPAVYPETLHGRWCECCFDVHLWCECSCGAIALVMRVLL